MNKNLINVYITNCSSINIDNVSKNFLDIKKYINKNDKQLSLCSLKYKMYFNKKYNCDVNDLYSANAKYFFSISHSFPYCVFCEYKNRIGIDIQKIDETIDWLSISNKYFTSEEKEYINNNIYKFYEIWTCKESLYKALSENKNITILDLEIINENGTFFYKKNKIYIFKHKKIENFILCVCNEKDNKEINIIEKKFSDL